MKNLFLLLLLSAFVTKINAQTTKPIDGIVSVTVARQMPSGDFYKTDINNKESGFAKSGLAIEVGYTHLFPRKTKSNKAISTGVNIALLNRNNGLDAAKMTEQKNGTGAGPVGIEASEYNSKFILGGFILHNHMDTKKLDSYIRGNIGVAFHTSPEISFIYNSGAQPEIREETKSTAMAYGFDGVLRYNFGNLGLGMEVSWLFSEAEFEFNNQKQKQGLNSLGLGLTVSYNLRFDRSLEL